jgi:hypothetical protein
LAQSYSSPDDAPGTALPAADPGEKFGFGFGYIGDPAEAELVVQTISSRKRYTTRAGSGGSGAKWVPDWSDEVLTVTAATTEDVTFETKIIRFTLAGGITGIAQLPEIRKYPKAVPIFIRRTDADGASTATIAAAAGENIDGVASINQAVTSGRTIVHDGSAWWTVS